MAWKKKLRRILRRVAGRDLVPYTLPFSAELRLIAILRTLRIGIVIDVGAGHGEFGSEMLLNGFDGDLISIEPLASAHGDLLRAARSRPRWRVVERCAAGCENGESVIHVTRRSGSSSLRKPLARHAQADRDSVEVGSETTSVRRLDDLIPPLVAPGERLFLKIDVQGAEEDVLEGAAGLMSAVLGMQVELSTVELYEGQKLMPEMLAQLARLGFSLWDLSPVYVDAATGRVLQYDGVFCRTECG